MRAVVFEEFGVLPEVREVPDPSVTPGGVVIAVDATGVCRSDWHSWQGHDTSVKLPHVAGHELAGRIASLGEGVRGWSVGDRVTVPFVCACGTCAQCAAGDQQICDREFQPGATHWGSFAEYVAIENAEVNLVALPDSMSAAEAAALGCRFGTAFRAVLRQGGVRPGQWVAVYGCGGVGVSAILLAVAAGASVVAVDPSPQARALASRMGAAVTVDASAFEGHEAVAEMLRVVETAGIDLAGMIGKRVGLDDVPAVLARMNDPVPAQAGVTVVEIGDSP